MGPGAPLSPGPMPALALTWAGALLRPGAPLSPGLTHRDLAIPLGALMRPGAPLSPGLVDKTRSPRQWFTRSHQVSRKISRLGCAGGGLAEGAGSGQVDGRAELCLPGDGGRLPVGGGGDLLQRAQVTG